MAIHDSDPERRNLVVSSLAFIAFYYAGGAFVDDSVRLQVVNVNFAHPERLAILAWLLLLWFVFRYWLTHRGIFKKAYEKELPYLYSKSYIKRFVSKKRNVKIVKNDEFGYHVYSIKKHLGKIYIHYCKSKSISLKEDGLFNQWQGFEDGTGGYVILEGWSSIIPKIRLHITCITRFPSFTSYVTPYILFVIAVNGPLFKKYF